MRSTVAVLVLAVLPWVVSCDKEKSAAPGKRRTAQPKPVPPPQALTPDGKKCRALAVRRSACKLARDKGYKRSLLAFGERVVMRACRRDLADPQTRPYQLPLAACARQTECKAFDDCYERASKPLREIHFKREMKKRGR